MRGMLARILPTRNGNRQQVAGALRGYKRTDPTYKEWKRGAINTYAYSPRRTDPTYKEWKQFI